MGTRSTPCSPEVTAALRLLVSQFSQPLAFLRELVQNSLDAGTNRVEVSVVHGAEEGWATVEVADTGEGMDRQVIDQQLTRLFSSSKEGDLTKIGKFGIGFVSVFAVKPRAVVVDTARGGEAWRVLFHEDLTFDRIALDEPIEGTRVRVYVPMARSRFEGFRQDCRRTLRTWCRHCEVEILFDGEAVNEPFGLEAPFQVFHSVPGTEVVVAPSSQEKPFCGFYNRGLTLLEGPASPLPGVSFKVRSRYLEHTLTRDNVLRDDSFDKAMEVVRQVAFKKMPVQLVRELQESPGPALWAAAATVLGWPEPPEVLRQARIFPALEGEGFSLQDLAGPKPPCYAPAPDELSRAAAAEGERVLHLSGDKDPVLGALRAAGVEPQAVARRWFLPREAATPSSLAPLLGELGAYLGALGLEEVRLVAPEASCPAVARVRALGRAQRVGDGEGRVLALQESWDLLLACARLAAHDPNLAACLLARGLALEIQAGPGVAADLLARAVQLRSAAPPAPKPARRERKGGKRGGRG